jgi:5-formyltetrahydrofolate cyclo-ligase
VQQTERDKERVREEALEARRDLDGEARRQASEQVCRRLQEWETTREPRPLVGYMAVDGEVDVSAFIDHKRNQGTRVALPRVIDETEMELVPVESLDDLEEGAFGIPEPVGPATDIADLEVFLVPGAAFDRHGGRVGMGWGYYDRMLSRRLDAGGAAPIFIGICFDCQVSDGAIPVEAHDVQMDAVVTESQIIDCR